MNTADDAGFQKVVTALFQEAGLDDPDVWSAIAAWANGDIEDPASTLALAEAVTAWLAGDGTVTVDGGRLDVSIPKAMAERIIDGKPAKLKAVVEDGQIVHITLDGSHRGRALGGD